MSPLVPTTTMKKTPASATRPAARSPFSKPSAALPPPAVEASPLVQITQKEILDSFKQPVILKHALRGPKFQLTPYAQYLADQNNDAFQREASKQNFEAMSNKLREMLDAVDV